MCIKRMMSSFNPIVINIRSLDQINGLLPILRLNVFLGKLFDYIFNLDLEAIIIDSILRFQQIKNNNIYILGPCRYIEGFQKFINSKFFNLEKGLNLATHSLPSDKKNINIGLNIVYLNNNRCLNVYIYEDLDLKNIGIKNVLCIEFYSISLIIEKSCEKVILDILDKDFNILILRSEPVRFIRIYKISTVLAIL